jgi:hypothetical protein
LSVSGKLTGTLSGFIARVKPASFGLLCAWREALILRQHVCHVLFLTIIRDVYCCCRRGEDGNGGGDPKGKTQIQHLTKENEHF